MSAEKISLFDAHFHIIDPAFPLVPNQGYLPPSFTAQNYLSAMDSFAVCGGAVVSGSFQAYDTSYLLHALQILGPTFVGVAQIPSHTTDQDIRRLHAGGVRAIRFNLKRVMLPDLQGLAHFSARVFDLVGWHSEFYVDATDLPVLEPHLSPIACLVIDHLGLSKEGLSILKAWLERGAYAKITFGRVAFDVIEAVRDLAAVNPEALVFGTDLPGTRALRLFHEDDVHNLRSALGFALSHQILYENAMKLYRIS